MDQDEPIALSAPKPNLEVMSVEELEDLIAELEAQIAEAREMIAAKRDARSDADSYFKP